MNDTQSTRRQSSAEAFFLEHAGYSYDPAVETKEQGRKRCARDLARAERYGRAQGWSLLVEPTGEQFAWQGECFDVVLDPRAFATAFALRRSPSTSTPATNVAAPSSGSPHA
ncbi:MAG: hypothetical protein KGL39_09095 [Patescibacteria group bacterium]|nr:hypothetical protein [Patescibacteria group bacterium]